MGSMILDRMSRFEKYPGLTLGCIIGLIVLIGYVIASIKFNNTSLKKTIHQYYLSGIIDNNIGRFIKLREHPPGKTKIDRPSRNYLKNIAPNSLERKYYTLKIDQAGFIEPSQIHADPDNSIIFLGGSTTECLYMAERERFPYLVGRQLEATVGKKINSYNGGVSANESKHSINIFYNKVLKMHPDIVVLMHNVNDLAVLRASGSYDYEHSLKSHLQNVHTLFSPNEFPAPSGKQASEETLLLAFERNLRTFIAMAKIHAIQPVLMTQANRLQNDALYHAFNEKIREISAQEKILMIDLAKEIPPTPEYLYDHYHYTATGARLAADRISAALSPYIAQERG